MNQQLQNRLAALHIEVDDTTAERHRATIAAELKAPGAPTRRGRTRRVRTASLVATALLLALPAAALASEGAVPGDPLYPVKRAAEQVIGIFDPNVETEHRIEELETVVERDAPQDEIWERLADAEEAVQSRGTPQDLSDRLDRVRDEISIRDGRTDDRPTDPAEDEQREDDDLPPIPTPTSTTTTTMEPDPPTTTLPQGDQDKDRGPVTTAPGDDDRSPRDSTTTTEPSRDEDGAPSDG